jgi:glycerol-3-phosphate dehydrogenase (NAD(P)+)
MIGLGNMGTAMGNLIASNGYDVLGWEYQGEVVDEINRGQTNSRFLEGIKLNPRLRATDDLESVGRQCEVIFIAIPSLFIQSTLIPIADRIKGDAIIVNLAKGIDRNSGLTTFQTISAMLPHHRKVMLSGPSIANEFARKMATVVVIASEEIENLYPVSRILDNDYYRTRFSNDVIGVELGGILKNIYSIGLGLFDGKSITSVNFRSVYLTIALEEMARIGVALGADLATFLYLAGTGDLLATSLSEHSHNRQLGHLLAEEFNLDQIRGKMGVLPEGYNSLQATLFIAEKMHVSLPLARGLWDVVHGRIDVDRFITSFIRDFVD